MGRMTPTELANIVEVHPNTIRNWADKGIIESRRDFRNWRYIPNPIETITRIRGLLCGDIKLEKLN